MRKQLFALFLILGFSGSLLAQRVTYPQLVNRSEAPEIFINELILPGEDSTTTLAFIFRFNFDFIPFKKIPSDSEFNAPSDNEFYSTIRLNSEIFEDKINRRNESSANSVSRDFWADTLFATNFEESQSRENYTAGFLSTELTPGQYHFILQLAMMQEVSERNTQRRNINIPDLSKTKMGEVYLIKDVAEQDETTQLQLMNMDDNVPYGKDFYALIRIPNYQSSSQYSVQVHRARTSRNDTTSASEVYTSALSPEDVFTDATIELQKGTDPQLQLSRGDGAFTYAVVNIPASTFENAGYILTLKSGDADMPAARTFFRSYWANMPASLYNLDIAIRHLKYILPEEQVKRIDSGSNEQREDKFREFWAERDPTPNTVYNELMAEYYRRIDYAYNEFGTPESPLGHESDQGEVYIKMGPPENKERTFPERGRTVEIWEYPNRTFVFESSGGFGNFKLVGTR